MRFCGGSDRNTGAGRVVGRSEPGGRGKWFWWATFPVPLALVTIKVDARKRIKMKKSPYELTDDQKKAMKEEIHAYFLDERDEDIGIILQEGLLDLFMDRLAPIVYNKALDDAKMWFSRRMDDVETDFYELYKNEQ